jgi:threonine dehydrogenase-like Zn-dependent dehydrogenase
LKESLYDLTSLHSRPHHSGAAGILGCAALTAVAAVRELTHGGADVAFEALGRTETFAQTSRMLADGGRMVAIGIAAGSSTAVIHLKISMRLVRPLLELKYPAEPFFVIAKG